MINISIKKSKNIKSEESIFVSFPYKASYVQGVKSLGIRFWHPEIKCWETTIENLPNLLNIFEGEEIMISGENKEYVPTFKTIENRELPDIKLKTTPMKHQIEAAKSLLNTNRLILGDQAGTGKTLSYIMAALARKELDGYKHTLIICGVNILKWNWVSEINKHTYEEGYIIGQRVNTKGKTYIGSTKDKLYDLENLPDNYFLITNIETLRNEELSSKLKDLCNKKIINFVILDESHVCCSPSAKQTKGWMSLEPECRGLATATPLMNKPLDLWAPLHWLKVEPHNFHQFKMHYAKMGGYGGHEVIGYKYLEDLQSDLNSVLLRRLKKDVLDLPEKINTIEYLDMEDDQQKLYDSVYNNIQSNIDKIMLMPNPLTAMLRLRQVTSNPDILVSSEVSCAKINRLDMLLEERVQNEKVVVVSNWTQVTDRLIDRYKKYNPAVITGQIKDNEKQIQQNKFQTDDTCRILIGTIKSMGTGITLTAASTMIYVDEPWNYAVKEEQCSERIYRIGTKTNVEIITLINRNTIDERIHQIIEDKKDIGEYIVDGVTKDKKEKLVNFLMS